MRIKVIVPFPMDEDGLRKRAEQIPQELCVGGTRAVFVPVKNSCAWGDSPHDSLLLDFFVYEEGLRAEIEGFDAVCIDSVSDSGLAPLRSRLSIPVVGPGQLSFHIACTLGHRFSIIAMWEKWNHMYNKVLTEQGLWSHCASIRNIGVVPDATNLLEGKDAVLPALEECARECVEVDGADVIVLGSTTMHQAHRYLADRLSVPVINPGLLAFKMAEILVNLGLKHSRHAYQPTGTT